MITMVFYLMGCLVFIVLQAFFSGSEIAFISTNIVRLQHRIQKGDEKAKIALQLVSNPEKFLATTLVGTNISVVISSSLATSLLIKLGVINSNVWITFLFTPIVVIFSELIPKNIGNYYREKFSCLVAPYIKFFELLFFPLVSSIESISRSFIKIFVGKKRRRSLFVTREEIRAIFKEVESSGVLDRGEKEAIEDIFDFKETKVKDVITTLKNIVGFDYVDELPVILKKARQHKFTRYPVFKNKKIIGYINIFDIFYNDKDWHALIRPVVRVGESQKLYEVFTGLRKKRESMALVMRGNKVLGIVTIEDIIREIITSIVKD